MTDKEEMAPYAGNQMPLVTHQLAILAYCWSLQVTCATGDAEPGPAEAAAGEVEINEKEVI